MLCCFLCLVLFFTQYILNIYIYTAYICGINPLEAGIRGILLSRPDILFLS